jgi:hypothetical protein
MKYEDKAQLILKILMANASPLTAGDIYDIMVNKSLVDFNLPEHSESSLTDEIQNYLYSGAITEPKLFSMISGKRCAYTPFDDLANVTLGSILDIYFEGQELPNPKTDEINGTAIIPLAQSEWDNDLFRQLMLEKDARVRYVGIFELLKTESNISYREDILLAALNDPNEKIKAAAIKSIRKDSSNQVYARFAELMDDDELYIEAQLTSLRMNNTQVYNKYAELVGAEDPRRAEIPCSVLKKFVYGNGIIAQFKVLENWDSCKDNFSKLGYSEDEVEEKIINSIRYHWRLPRFAREYLMEMCNSSNGVVQSQALKCLDERWAKKDLKILEALNTEGNPRARELQLKNIALLNGQKSISLAINLLNDPIVCNTAVEVLGEHGLESELETLMNIANDVVKRNQYDLKILAQAIIKLKKKLK